ncbi:hypothetical protein GCM10009687_46590 [Asanoa iriomotensis]|uniref:Uncharacterized protein n=1 Tax=Asanoa iriomotensis TaxID=234613 RepID=A0ABQ4BXN4_9ACTN|nr:hypothetical protein Air01nite_13970 [Asanoa iriomotensis]
MLPAHAGMVSSQKAFWTWMEMCSRRTRGWADDVAVPAALVLPAHAGMVETCAGSQLSTVVGVAQRTDHASQDPERV